jgi:hypothetical protein
MIAIAPKSDDITRSDFNFHAAASFCGRRSPYFRLLVC